jgi:hypothetical protein
LDRGRKLKILIGLLGGREHRLRTRLSLKSFWMGESWTGLVDGRQLDRATVRESLLDGRQLDMATGRERA